MPNIRMLCVAAALVVPMLLAGQSRQVLVLSQLQWFDRTGTRLSTIGPLADHGNLELSPDGSRVAVAVLDRATASRDLWIYDARSGNRTRFTSERADENWMIWSPDGLRVVLNSFASDRVALFESPAATSASRALLTEGEARWPVSWSPDGRFIAYVTNGTTTSNDVWVLPLFGDRQPTPYLRTAASENWAAFSPNGRWLAFSSTATGQAEVYVAPFPVSGNNWKRVSADGGSQPRWRRDGSEIFYLDPDRTLIAASVKSTESEFEVTDLRPLFTLKYPYGAYHAFDVTDDGARFVVNTLVVDPRASTVIARREDLGLGRE